MPSQNLRPDLRGYHERAVKLVSVGRSTANCLSYLTSGAREAEREPSVRGNHLLALPGSLAGYTETGWNDVARATI